MSFFPLTTQHWTHTSTTERGPIHRSVVIPNILTHPPLLLIQGPRFWFMYNEIHSTMFSISCAKSSLEAQYTTNVAPNARKATIRPQLVPVWKISSAIPTKVAYVDAGVRWSWSHMVSNNCLFSSINSSATRRKWRAAGEVDSTWYPAKKIFLCRSL